MCADSERWIDIETDGPGLQTASVPLLSGRPGDADSVSCSDGTRRPPAAFLYSEAMLMRLFGLLLLTLSLVIPSCQAVFPQGGADAPQLFRPGFIRE
jgi:hypothetical protein